MVCKVVDFVVVVGVFDDVFGVDVIDDVCFVFVGLG